MAQCKGHSDAGDWGSKEESMADTYMREAQLVLKAQEMCLHTLRSGTVPAVESSHGAVDGGRLRLEAKLAGFDPSLFEESALGLCSEFLAQEFQGASRDPSRLRGTTLPSSTRAS